MSQASKKTGKRNAFEVSTPDRVYYLVADDHMEMEDWMKKIKKAHDVSNPTVEVRT